MEEAEDAEAAAGDVAGEDGEPDVYGFERGELLYGEADAKRDRDLGDYRDIERTFCITGSLKAASVGQGH